MGRVLAGGREPLISRIKLAWWRESLEKLDEGRPPAEPLLEAAFAELLPRGLSGGELARMEEGWTVLLGDEPLDAAALDLYAAARGGLLFRFTARLVGPDEPAVAQAGEAWALVDLARHSGNSAEREVALQAARARAGPRRWPGPLRPLGMLAMLAARDAEPLRPQWEPPGSPARMWRMLRHRLSGF
jgi:15-cis-phytoene synthase